MGYYSRKSVEIEEQRVCLPDHSYPSEENMLYFRLAELVDRLDELDAVRPRDPMHPLYDRYFYQDHLIHYYEEPHTVQGILRAIDEVKELIWQREKAEDEERRLIAAIRDTGADPNGQIVFVGMFLPFLETAVPA